MKGPTSGAMSSPSLKAISWKLQGTWNDDIMGHSRTQASESRATSSPFKTLPTPSQKEMHVV